MTHFIHLQKSCVWDRERVDRDQRYINIFSWICEKIGFPRSFFLSLKSRRRSRCCELSLSYILRADHFFSVPLFFRLSSLRRVSHAIFFLFLLTTEGQWVRRFRRFNYSWKKSCGLEDWNRDIKGFHRFCELSNVIVFIVMVLCRLQRSFLILSFALFSAYRHTHPPRSWRELVRDLKRYFTDRVQPTFDFVFFFSPVIAATMIPLIWRLFFVLVSNAQPPPVVVVMNMVVDVSELKGKGERDEMSES